jgi:hypothetical protein
MNETEENFGRIYFAVLGAVALAFGVAELIATVPGEASWGIMDLEGFLASYAPPYCPEMFLLPFSLVIIYYILKEGETEK